MHDGHHIYKTAECVSTKIRPLGMTTIRRRECVKTSSRHLHEHIKPDIHCEQLNVNDDGYCVDVHVMRVHRSDALTNSCYLEADANAVFLFHAAKYAQFAVIRTERVAVTAYTADAAFVITRCIC